MLLCNIAQVTLQMLQLHYNVYRGLMYPVDISQNALLPPEPSAAVLLCDEFM